MTKIIEKPVSSISEGSLKTPLVSVVIPVYNVCKYVSQCLDSVLCQSYQNLEIIVIDDGSSDGSGLVCDDFSRKDSRIRVIHQENQGLSSARNTGLNSMTGEIVAFLDSDDAFHPEMIQRMVSVIVAEDADVVTCSYSKHYTEKHMPIQPLGEYQTVIYDRTGALKALIEGKISWFVWDKIYKRKCFENIRFPHGHVYEDVDTIYKVLAISDKIVYCCEPLVMYRKRVGSITEVYSLESAKDRDRAFSHVVEFVKKNTPEIFSEEQKQKVSSVWLAGTLGTYARSGKEAWKYRDEVSRAMVNVDIKRCDLQTKGKLFLYSHCPRIYVAIHKPLRSAKRQILICKAFLTKLYQRIASLATINRK